MVITIMIGELSLSMVYSLCGNIRNPPPPAPLPITIGPVLAYVMSRLDNPSPLFVLNNTHASTTWTTTLKLGGLYQTMCTIMALENHQQNR